jgi:hypothetical protein
MDEYRVRRLPVLDHDHRLVGIVSVSDLSGRNWNTRPYRVVFYKELTTSASGQLRRVPLAIVHITDRHARDEVEAAAIRKFERDPAVVPGGTWPTATRRSSRREARGAAIAWRATVTVVSPTGAPGRRAF